MGSMLAKSRVMKNNTVERLATGTYTIKGKEKKEKIKKEKKQKKEKLKNKS